MNLGDTFQIAKCRNCGERISHIYWGNGGNIWEHSATLSAYCTKPVVAQPDPDTLRSL